jgi:methylglutamate dehydrogenase subunit D
MVEQLSPLEPVYRIGRHGNPASEPGVVLTETRAGSIVQVSAWPGKDAAILAAISQAAGLPIADTPRAGALSGPRSGFGIGPGQWLIVDQAEGLAEKLASAIDIETGTVTDLSHGRTALRVSGPKAEWVLAKFFAIDFSLPAFPVQAGCATAHHDIFAHIQRTAGDAFDLYVFRSFARAFWTALTHAAEEVGYEVR